MTPRDSRTRWLACSAAALFVLLLMCVALPERWLAALFFAPLRTAAVDRALDPMRVFPLYPPLEIVPDHDEVRREPEVPAPVTMPTDPAWWRAAWRVYVGERVGGVWPDTIVAKDTGAALACPFEVRGLEAALADTSLAARLALFEAMFGDDYDRLKPWAWNMARRRQYLSILQTEARLFGEFLHEGRLESLRRSPPVER
jgi:hypothetical protein